MATELSREEKLKKARELMEQKKQTVMKMSPARTKLEEYKLKQNLKQTTSLKNAQVITLEEAEELINNGQENKIWFFRDYLPIVVNKDQKFAVEFIYNTIAEFDSVTSPSENTLLTDEQFFHFVNEVAGDAQTRFVTMKDLGIDKEEIKKALKIAKEERDNPKPKQEEAKDDQLGSQQNQASSNLFIPRADLFKKYTDTVYEMENNFNDINWLKAALEEDYSNILMLTDCYNKIGSKKVRDICLRIHVLESVLRRTIDSGDKVRCVNAMNKTFGLSQKTQKMLFDELYDKYFLTDFDYGTIAILDKAKPNKKAKKEKERVI